MKEFINQLGGLAVAAAVVVAAVMLTTQATKAMDLWQKQLKADAIDGCFTAATYTQTSVEASKDGKQVSKADSFPISWMFDDCMKNKGYESYERTDFTKVNNK
jgi:hypothetical protein